MICTFLNTFENRLFKTKLKQIKTTEQRNWFISPYSKEKEILKETSQGTKIDIKNVVSQWLVKKLTWNINGTKMEHGMELYLSVAAFFILKISNNFVAFSLENMKFSTYEWNIWQICFVL